MNTHETRETRPRFRAQPSIEVFQLRKLGEIVPDPNGDGHPIDLAFGLVAQAARETVRTDELVTSEFKFTDDFATWSVTVSVDPIERIA